MRVEGTSVVIRQGSNCEQVAREPVTCAGAPWSNLENLIDEEGEENEDGEGVKGGDMEIEV